jgi:hypothetical protein
MISSLSPPDDARTGVRIGTLPAFLQDRRETWTATSTSRPDYGRRRPAMDRACQCISFRSAPRAAL